MTKQYEVSSVWGDLRPLFGGPCVSITRLVLSGTDFVDSGKEIDENAIVNYLHGQKWVYNPNSPLFMQILFEFTECDHHTSEVVPYSEDLLNVAFKHNLNRIPRETQDLYPSYRYKYQDNPCDVPRCISSLDDLLVCGGVGLSVREWATIRGVDPVPVQSGPRGLNCETLRLATWMDSNAIELLPGRHSLHKMLAMVNFARKPVICE